MADPSPPLPDGIFQLSKPTVGELDFDIVLFHGLSLLEANQPDSYYRTWKAKKENGDDCDVGLVELLTNDFAARVLSVSWDSRAFGVPKLEWRKRSGLVLTGLINAKVGERPVVFIGHSMGGLMMKQVIVSLHVQSNKKILGQLKSAVFIATPHKGSKLADEIATKKLRNRVINVFTGEPTTLVHMLTVFDGNSTFLGKDYRDIVRALKEKLPRDHTFSLAFAETKPTKRTIWGFLKFDGIIVEDASADADMDGCIDVNADHVDIACPQDGKGMYASLKTHLETVTRCSFRVIKRVVKYGAGHELGRFTQFGNNTWKRTLEPSANPQCLPTEVVYNQVDRVSSDAVVSLVATNSVAKGIQDQYVINFTDGTITTNPQWTAHILKDVQALPAYVKYAGGNEYGYFERIANPRKEVFWRQHRVIDGKVDYFTFKEVARTPYHVLLHDKFRKHPPPDWPLVVELDLVDRSVRVRHPDHALTDACSRYEWIAHIEEFR